MACIGDAKRDTVPIHEQPNLGPGCYEVQKEEKRRPSYAPFSSMQPKFCDSKPLKPDSAQVGPGTFFRYSRLIRHCKGYCFALLYENRK